MVKLKEVDLKRHITYIYKDLVIIIIVVQNFCFLSQEFLYI